ncbi:MAG: hypothetical protein N2044_04150 [Cyclobacteriaceae bacterium]|nr:hypothetical protein [Cyclobacteriaceae bacterium]MCX7637020.1 hypothetical protein [Cyclobacteriaceae bacterium]MDW8330142.1 hypothetical protein [Cyclobacteriaceae bacterium]
MNFEIDVLILFSQSDNAPQQGSWVTQFKRFLEVMLIQVLGEKLNIQLKSETDNLITPRLDNAATLVTILSHQFVRSGQCLDNLEMFCKAAEKTPSPYNRIFKVFKTQLSWAEQPPRIRELLGYEMYQIDNDTGEVREYSDYFSSEAERQYWMKMVDLAYDIYDTLLALRGQEKPEIKKLYGRKTIYLAETGHDLTVQRNIIRRELQRLGYVVLPAKTLPSEYREFERAVRQNLEEADMSIHLIGSAYGEIPEGSDRSAMDIQNMLAAEKSERVGKERFPRLIWISPVLVNVSERQRAFIELLKRDIALQEGAEILQTPLEDFKNIIREELQEKHGSLLSGSDSARTVYLLHDKVDQDEVKPVIETLQQKGYKVLVPDFEGELMRVRNTHISNLRNFDTAIIYKGRVNEQWVRMKILDLLKAPGLGRSKPVKGKAVLTRTGSPLNLDVFAKHNLRVVETEPGKAAENALKLLSEFENE